MKNARRGACPRFVLFPFRTLTNTTAAGSQPHVDTGGCDTIYPYPGYPDSSGAVDSPGSILQTNYTSVSRNFTATMYLMWQPNSTNAAVNGDSVVWVPLRSYQWNWSGTATNASPTTNNGTGWGVATSSLPSSTATNVDTTNEPTWSTNSANNWNPPF